MEQFINFITQHYLLFDIITLFLICIFFYYLIWTISQPFNSCPDEEMKWDICKYIYENNRLPHGEDEAIRNPIWGISYGFQPILTYIISAVFMKFICIYNTSICVSGSSKISKYNKYDISNIFYNKNITETF